ncbi:MAG TPA: hypothetical protein VMJ10_20390 [Kofleriaceae bacterium]|nr:hypothetical protein [Kofleriaceae bacterium]
MSRLVVIALLVAGCSCGSKSAGSDNAPAPRPAGPEKIAVPGPGPGNPPPVAGADNPQFHLKPEEGTLTVDKASAKAGAEATANITVQPAQGYHVSKEFPVKLTLNAPDGITLAKTELAAGDAATFTEQQLAFAVKATAQKPGAYEITGTFKFGVCDKDSCHPKKQPITIQVAAN